MGGITTLPEHPENFVETRQFLRGEDGLGDSRQAASPNGLVDPHDATTEHLDDPAGSCPLGDRPLPTNGMWDSASSFRLEVRGDGPMGNKELELGGRCSIELMEVYRSHHGTVLLNGLLAKLVTAQLEVVSPFQLLVSHYY